MTEVDWERLRRCVSLESEEKGKQIEMMTDKQMDRISTYRLDPWKGPVKNVLNMFLVLPLSSIFNQQE